MLKQLILGAAGIALSFSALANTNLTAASQITVKAATVEQADMGPLGQTKAVIPSTEVKMDLTNSSNQPITLVAATSPFAQQVQLHHFVKIDGKETMQQINQITLAAKSTDDLAFNGVHIMLIGVKHALKATEEIPLTLIFADGSHVAVNAKVMTATKVATTK